MLLKMGTASGHTNRSFSTSLQPKHPLEHPSSLSNATESSQDATDYPSTSTKHRYFTPDSQSNAGSQKESVSFFTNLNQHRGWSSAWAKKPPNGGLLSQPLSGQSHSPKNNRENFEHLSAGLRQSILALLESSLRLCKTAS